MNSKDIGGNNPAAPKKAPGVEKSETRGSYVKMFKVRDSYLTNSQGRNMVWIVFLLLSVESVCKDYFTEGRILLGMPTFKTGFAGIHYALLYWLAVHLIAFGVFYGFSIWSAISARLTQKTLLGIVFNLLVLLVYISSQTFVLLTMGFYCFKMELGFASGFALSLDICRLLMKMHSFVRTNVPRFLAQDRGTVAYTPPTFRSYLYFLFAPTLIYRDDYPRSSGPISWSFAMVCFLEVVICAFIECFLFENHLRPLMVGFATPYLTFSGFVLKVIAVAPIALSMLAVSFYTVIHAAQNVFAELLRFGDRLFYRCWWSARNYDEYFRSWNCIVQDWLYEFVYKDFSKHVFWGSRILSGEMVFLLSAIVHEYIFFCSAQIFVPVVLFFMGIFGIPIVCGCQNISQRVGNIIFWANFPMGVAICFSLYFMEYYAKFECPKDYGSVTDYFIPNLFTCFYKKYDLLRVCVM